MRLVPFLASLLIGMVVPVPPSARDGTVLDEGHSDHRPVIVTIEPRS